MSGLTYNQIISLACEAAHSPGKTTQAQNFIVSILRDLCQNYDLAAARGLATITLNPTLNGTVGNQNIYGSGPYSLPADFLRCSGSSGSAGAQKSFIWYLNGVPYPMLPCDLAEFDMQVQQAGQQSYPYIFATDLSQSPPVAYVWPPPSGAFGTNFRYQKQMADPTDFTQPSWFPNDAYLLKKLTGYMCLLNDDTRYQQLLGSADVEGSADSDLDKYLKMKDDDNSRAKTVQLDRRRFNLGSKQLGGFSSLANTKTVGW